MFGQGQKSAPLKKSEAKIRSDLDLGMDVGRRFDAVLINERHASVAGIPQESLVSSIIFAGSKESILGWFKGNSYHALAQQVEEHDVRVEALGNVRRALWQ